MARSLNGKSRFTNPLAESIPAATESFLNFCRSKNLSQCSVTYYRYRLLSFTRFLDLEYPGISTGNVTRQVVRDFVAYETSHNSPSTANHSIITLKAFFNYLVGDGILKSNPMEGINKVRTRKTVIETFSTDQVEAVLSTCSKEFTGIRDRAILLVFLDSGLRVSELCGLTIDDISWADQTLLVLGKGDKERIVPFGQTTKKALVQYLARRGELETKSLFVTSYADPIDRYRVREVIQARCSAAGVTGVRCSPHARHPADVPVMVVLNRVNDAYAVDVNVAKHAVRII